MKSKILTLILSFVISFGLWLYVVTVISPESESIYYNVPVELVGADHLDAQNLIIVSDTKNLKMDLTLNGNRSDLSKLDSSNITIIADLSKITQPGEHKLACTVSYQSGTAKVVHQNPEYITVVVEEQSSKNIPVQVIYTGSVHEGYEADKEATTMDHTSVTVKGPKNTIDQIAYAGITVDLSGRMTSFVGDYALTLYGSNSQPLVNDQFVSMNVTEVSAVVEVYKFKKIALNYVLDMENSGLLEEMVTLTPVKEITLIGSDEALARLDDQFTNGQFTFVIKLSDYQQTSTATLSLPLPQGVKCKEKIDIQIGIPIMESKPLILSKERFQLTQIPEGFSAAILGTQELAIWGPKDVLDQLNMDDLMILMDCSKLESQPDSTSIVYTVQGYEYLRVSVLRSNVNISLQDAEG